MASGMVPDKDTDQRGGNAPKSTHTRSILSSFFAFAEIAACLIT